MHFTSIYFHKNLREVFHYNFFYVFLNVQYFSGPIFPANCHRSGTKLSMLIKGKITAEKVYVHALVLTD